MLDHLVQMQCVGVFGFMKLCCVAENCVWFCSECSYSYGFFNNLVGFLSSPLALCVFSLFSSVCVFSLLLPFPQVTGL